MTKNTRRAVIGTVIGILVIAGLKALQIFIAIASGGSFTPPPEAVTSTVVQKSAWSNNLEVIGSLAAVNGAMLSTEEPGKVAQIGFESGAHVKAGDILVALDTSVEEAQLHAAEAKQDWMKITLDRRLSLKSTKAISQSDLDQSEAELRQSEGEANSIRAMIRRKKVISPIDGIAGIRQVNVGQIVTQGTPVVPVFATDPIYVNFSIPQREASHIKIGQSFSMHLDTVPDRDFPAKVTAIDPQLSEATRNLGIQGTIENKDGILKPGMFVQILFPISETTDVVVLPQTAIVYAPYGDSVYIIEKMKDPKNKDKDYLGVRQQTVKLGGKRGDQIAILSGLEPGQEVVTSGLFKLRPGVGVLVDNSMTPGNNPNPNPPNT